jgi:hypothetical protein
MWAEISGCVAVERSGLKFIDASYVVHPLNHRIS